MALLERERELTAIDAIVDNVGHGEGGGLLMHGHAGIGKTTLIAAAVGRARAAGLRVLSACGGELEQSYAFGVVRQLYDPLLRAGPEPERARMLSGAARLAAPVFGLPSITAAPAPADPQEAALLGLFWLTSDLADRQPLLIALDDLQWADRASLEWLVFTLRRLTGLSVAVIGAARTGEGVEFDHLVPEGGHVAVVTLEPLSHDGVRAVLTEHLESSPDEAFVHAVIEATAGNPMLVREVARAIADGGHEPTGDRATEAVRVPSEQLKRLVEARLARLPPDAAALARGAAVMGAGAELRHVATLSGVELERAGEAADQLRASDIFAPGSRVSFTPSPGARHRRGLDPLRQAGRRARPRGTTARRRTGAARGRGGASTAMRAGERLVGGRSPARGEPRRLNARRPRQRGHPPASRAA